MQSLNNKVDELCPRTKFISDYRNAPVLCFTETWLKPDTPNTHVEPDGFTVYRNLPREQRKDNVIEDILSRLKRVEMCEACAPATA